MFLDICFIYHFVEQFMLSSNMTVVFHFSLTKTPHFGFYRGIYWLQKIEFLKNDHIYLIWVSFVDLNELILNIYIYIYIFIPSLHSENIGAFRLLPCTTENPRRRRTYSESAHLFFGVNISRGKTRNGVSRWPPHISLIK